MESVFYNGGIIGATLDFGATDRYIIGYQDVQGPPTLVGATSAGLGTGTVPTALTLPSGLQQGDLVIVMIASDSASTHTLVSGWTSIYTSTSNSVGIRVAYKIMTATPDTTYTSTSGGGTANAGLALAYRGVNPASIFDATTTTATSGTNSQPNGPSITTVTNNSLVLSLVAIDDNNVSAPTPPAGYSLITAVGQSGAVSVAAAGITKTTAGAEDPGAYAGYTADTWHGVTIALKAVTTQQPIYGNLKNSGIWNIQAAYEEVYSNLPVDPNFANVSLLLHGDGANNGTVITDSSSNAVAFTRVNSPVTSTTQSKFGGSSIWFERATGDFLSKTSSATDALFTFGTGDFTIELWLYLNSPPTVGQNIIDFRPVGVHGAHVLLTFFSDSTLTFWSNTAQRIIGPILSTGQWYHIALSRVSSQTRMFVNGSQVGTTYADTTNYLLGGSDRPFIGSGSFVTGGDNRLDGYIDELRITKGVGRYASNFTVPTQPYPDR